MAPRIFLLSPADCGGERARLLLSPRGRAFPSARLRAAGRVDIRGDNPRYRRPLKTTARAVARAAGPQAEVVLLGSIASDKYVGVLGAIFGERLCFPAEFVGRGDMSRGGLPPRPRAIVIRRFATAPAPLAAQVVATVCPWEELAHRPRLEDFQIDNVRARLAQVGDLGRPLLAARGRFDLRRLG